MDDRSRLFFLPREKKPRLITIHGVKVLAVGNLFVVAPKGTPAAQVTKLLKAEPRATEMKGQCEQLWTQRRRARPSAF